MTTYATLIKFTSEGPNSITDFGKAWESAAQHIAALGIKVHRRLWPAGTVRHDDSVRGGRPEVGRQTAPLTRVARGRHQDRDVDVSSLSTSS